MGKRQRVLQLLLSEFKTVSDDKVTVYAAQASFFTIISAVPFLSLLLAAFSLVLPDIALRFLSDRSLSPELLSILGPILEDLQSAPRISLLSFSAIFTLWSASKGTSALRAGLEIIYRADAPEGFLFQRLRSLGNTLAFIALILCSVVLLLFGDFLDDLIPFFSISGFLLYWRTPFLVLFMCVVSKGYALYIRYFPNASAIYGSLGALCLIMLWLYFCMVILLLGAEVNKLVYTLRGSRQ